jgi:hypothetical protein
MMLLYVPGMVAGLSVSCVDADLVASAWENAVTVTLAGRSGSTVGAVYKPFASMVPPFGVGTDQVTAVLLVPVTVAVNCAVCSGHPALLGKTLDGTPGSTVTCTVAPVPTVSVSVGVACVSFPSVPWIVKLNVPAVSLPNVTANGAPPVVGVTDDGVHVPGAPAVHVSATLPLYPFKAVSVPFQVTF